MGRGDLLASPRASACVRVAYAAVRALVGRARERRVIRMVKSAFLGYVSVFLEGIHFQTGKIPLPYRALQVNLATHIGKMRANTANEPGNARAPRERTPPLARVKADWPAFDDARPKL